MGLRAEEPPERAPLTWPLEPGPCERGGLAVCGARLSVLGSVLSGRDDSGERGAGAGAGAGDI